MLPSASIAGGSSGLNDPTTGIDRSCGGDCSNVGQVPAGIESLSAASLQHTKTGIDIAASVNMGGAIGFGAPRRSC